MLETFLELFTIKFYWILLLVSISEVLFVKKIFVLTIFINLTIKIIFAHFGFSSNSSEKTLSAEKTPKPQKPETPSERMCNC